MPTIYLITPTNNKNPTQMADLTRLRNTLWLVPKLVWLLVEDSAKKTKKIVEFLEYSKIPYIHLNEATPLDFKLNSNDKPWSKPRGVMQRNKALAWLREHRDELKEGVVYFGDDDNTYDIRLFEEVFFFILKYYSDYYYYLYIYYLVNYFFLFIAR
jgi:galactosylgalactosylxylosylprotein 3-beta-glucuronosyltransferase 3